MMRSNDGASVQSWEVEEIDKVAIKEPQDELTFQKVFAYKVLSNPDAETGKYVIRTKTGAAEIVRKGSKYPKLHIVGNTVTYELFDVGIAYTVNKTDINVSKTFNRPLNLEYVETAREEVYEKMNSFVYRGDADYGITGILEYSGVTTITGTDLDTSDLNLFNEVQTCFDSLPSKYRNKQYTLVVADAEAKKFNKIGNTNTNESWKTIIQKNIPNLTIITESELTAGKSLGGGGTITAGTALLIPKDLKLVNIPVGRPVKSVISSTTVNDPFYDDIEGKVEGRLGPVEIPFPTAVGKISGW